MITDFSSETLQAKRWYATLFFFSFYFFNFFIIIIFFIVVDFVIYWNETAMGLHVFPIPIPPPTSLSTLSL